MLSIRAKKGIIFGLLGGTVGFVIALVLFFFSFITLFGYWGGAPKYFPAQVLIIGVILSFIILILSLILKFRRFGILISLIIFLISYLITLKICRMQNLPIAVATEIPVFRAIVLIIPFLVWAMFIIRGIKIGTFLTNKNNKQKWHRKC